MRSKQVGFSDRWHVGSEREDSIMTPMSPIKATRCIVMPFIEMRGENKFALGYIVEMPAEYLSGDIKKVL